MTTNDIGNGTSIEIVMLMPKDIPIQITWLIKNHLLIEFNLFFTYIIYYLITGY